MNENTHRISQPAAAAIASCAFTVPLALSLSSTPSPNHPRTMLWYLMLREPAFKPPDWLFPVCLDRDRGGVSGCRVPIIARATQRCSNESAGVVGLEYIYDRGLEPSILQTAQLGRQHRRRGGLGRHQRRIRQRSEASR